MSRTLHLFGTDWCAMMVPIQVIRWYRMQCYDGTDSCATVVPIRRYCHQINTRYYNGGSTGRITIDLKKVIEANGIESYAAFGFGYNPKDDEKENVYQIESDRQLFISKLWTKATCHHGFNNKRETRRLLAWIDEIKPDIIHMHNIHNHYVNVRMLLEYISTKNIPCVLTMHDCWTFTGHCAYFDFSGCDK